MTKKNRKQSDGHQKAKVTKQVEKQQPVDDKLDKEMLNSLAKDPSKIYKLDPDAKKGKQELLVITIQTKDRVIEVTIREGTNVNLLNDKISVLADFKSCPKKFKEIF